MLCASLPHYTIRISSLKTGARANRSRHYTILINGLILLQHGVVHDMNFLGDLPADAQEVLSGKEWVPQSVSDFTARWEKDAPELANQARQLDSLITKFEKDSVQFGKSEAYLRDISIHVCPPPPKYRNQQQYNPCRPVECFLTSYILQTTLERAAARDVSPVEIALTHFWTAYSEVPSGGSKRTFCSTWPLINVPPPWPRYLNFEPKLVCAFL